MYSFGFLIIRSLLVNFISLLFHLNELKLLRTLFLFVILNPISFQAALQSHVSDTFDQHVAGDF